MSKELGVFYTPYILVDFISSILPRPNASKTEIKVLEPSCGDGRFILSLAKKWKSKNLSGTLIDVDMDACKIARLNVKKLSKGFKVFNKDFLLHNTKKNLYDYVIGNPPYIAKKYLSDKQRKQFQETLKLHGLPESVDKNIWVSFLLKSVESLNSTGVIVFVLPFELLQVKYCEVVQKYLEKNFQRIEIFTFNNLMFQSAGQDTVVLVARKKSTKKGIYIYDVSTNKSDDKIHEFKAIELCRKNSLKRNGVKWSSLLLNDDDLNFLTDISSELPTVDDCVYSKPGIVTAANNYFIVNSYIVKKFKLQSYAKPVVQKSLFVNSSVTFTKSDFKKLDRNGMPSFFLDFSGYSPCSRKGVEAYLEGGMSEEIHRRYKCEIRKYWYKVPIVEPGEGFFFKRSHEYPKLLKNTCSAYTTDSAYNIFPKNNFDISSFVYSFYNPLTLCFSELLGRYYGGGVLELTPSEFKKLPIPYMKLKCKGDFVTFKKDFEDKGSIHEILSSYGKKILLQLDFVDRRDVERIISIYRKLSQRRLNRISLEKR